MIVAAQRSLLSQAFDLSDAGGSGKPFGEITFHMFGGGTLVVGDAAYEIETHGLFKPRTELVLGGATLAVARQPSAFSGRYEVAVAPEVLGLEAEVGLELVPEGWTSSRWSIRADGLDAGTAGWSGAFRESLRLDLSGALPLTVQCFVAAVLVVQRGRDTSSVD